MKTQTLPIIFLTVLGQIIFSAEQILIDEDTSKSALEVQNTPIVDQRGKQYYPDDYDHWYGKHLFTMGESSLYSIDDSAGDIQMRFLCLPTFSKPICFRGFKKEGRFFIRVVRLTGQGGYEPGRIEIDTNIEITQQEWTTLLQDVTKSTNDFKISSDQKSILAGLDGTQWVLEARINGKYYFQEMSEPEFWISKEGIVSLEEIDRGTAGKYKLNELNIGTFRDACRRFLILTDFTIPSRMVPAELQSEQANPGQPTNRPESKSEGGDKPQPEAEGRSR